ncbi:hypothetical protein KP509_22G072700 [Ceratopteris richardii]|uniref:Uncharacterized protein n=1 Tax=Ceratopteris richardii TaxID=49495 RepID=A0A8T2S6D0_CERRI|nr:hypothetical protein KP509_22G072700 [Ceratopteris richardii]KAH7307694.1 hypothetical protein KP509_22G072700 [Ceratopteris richardii]KAH7307695.1 hypothetical protein KP509_22G072700 [Ceratopteris richardii]KAH7307696.1 hypothetical protein KP509_22G072700 [Ceratopteris richardii]KAH7307697.1 hypothetical protein KP509_22G072700 [Ceratopteris richardii]
MAKVADDGKKKRARSSGSDDQARNSKENGGVSEEPIVTSVQDEPIQSRGRDNLVLKKIRTNVGDMSSMPESAEENKGKDRKGSIMDNLSAFKKRKKKRSSVDVEDLRSYIESLGGDLGDGWQVDSHRRHGAGKLTKVYISPSKFKFRSRAEVARHLGLPYNIQKADELDPNALLTPSPMDVDKEEQRVGATNGTISVKRKSVNGPENKLHEIQKAVMSGQQQEHASTSPSLQKEAAKNCSTGLTSLTNAFKTVGNTRESPPASIVTERCQDVLRRILSTESFASLNTIFKRGSPSGTMDSSLPIKTFPGSIDLQLIQLRLSNGVYGLSPELFSADINEVWKNIIAVGKEQVALAQQLSEFTEDLYKQQIMSLFQRSALEEASEGMGQLASENDKQIKKGMLLALTDSHILQDNVPHNVTPMKLSSNTLVMDKKSSNQSLKGRKKATKPEGPKVIIALGKVEDKDLMRACRSCSLRLDQGTDCIVCKKCSAMFHTRCMDLSSNSVDKSKWFCPLCERKEDTSKAKHTRSSDNTTKEYQQMLGAKVCEKCKKGDSNLLLCGGCEAAYHLNCINFPAGSNLGELWLCEKCGVGKCSLKHIEITNFNPEGHNNLMHIQSSNVSVSAHGTEENSSKRPLPIGGGPNEGVEHIAANNFNQLRTTSITVDNDLSEHQFLLGNDNACKACRVESSKGTISCSFCSNCFHLSCLKPPLKRVPRNTWYCPSCLCRVCKIDTDDDKILLCDGCDEGYHTYCLNPPLTEKPKGAWFCPSCVKSEEPASPLSKRTEVSKRKRKSTEPRRST